MNKKFYIVANRPINPSGTIVPVKVISNNPIIYGRPIIKLTPVTQVTQVTPITQVIPVTPIKKITPVSGSCMSGVGASTCSSGITINKNLPITIKIISEKGEFTIYAPLKYMRSIIDDIYAMANPNNINIADKTTFRIITPSIDAIVNTSLQNMIDTVKKIGEKYNSIEYMGENGDKLSLIELLNRLNAFNTIMNVNKNILIY